MRSALFEPTGPHLYILAEDVRRGIGRALMGKAKAARAVYGALGFTLVKLTDGAGNEEREPDALYQWPLPFDPSPVVAVE